ncbi:MAG: hypothetical protein AAGD25_17125 [Cyanobacteria bacterium P01_F01_bin.150]
MPWLDAPDAFTATLEAEQQLSDDDWRRRSEDVNVAQFLAIAPRAPYVIYTL